MVHRNVHFFRRQTPIIYNQTINVRQCTTKSCSGFGGMMSNPMMLMQMLSMAQYTIGDLFSCFKKDDSTINPKQEDGVDPNKAANDQTVKNLETIYSGTKWIYEDGEFWGAKDGQIVAHGKTFADAKAAMDKFLGIGTEIEVETDTDIETDVETDTSIGTDTDIDTDIGTETDTDIDTDIDTYRIVTNTITDVTYEVKSGNTWWGIVAANYNVQGLTGGQITQLALQLAAANSGIEDSTQALAAARKGLYFKVGDKIKLPDKLTAGGKTVERNGTITAAANQSYTFANSGTMVTSSTANSRTTYTIFVNGEEKGTYDTEEEALQHKPEGAVLKENT